MFGKVYIFAKLKSSAFRKYILLQTDFEMIFQQVELYNPRFAHFCHLQNHQNACRLHKWACKTTNVGHLISKIRKVMRPWSSIS